MEHTEEQNEIIGKKFDGLMDSVFNLIDELYKRDEDNFTEGEQKFYDAFHEYIWALGDEELEEAEMYKIILNAREIEVQSNELSYEEIAKLAYGVKFNPDAVYTMTYSYGRNHCDGMTKGDIVAIHQGMLIDVSLTNNA
jgi:hypothetical protein